jgi:hypothetical protein
LAVLFPTNPLLKGTVIKFRALKLALKKNENRSNNKSLEYFKKGKDVFINEELLKKIK